MFLKYKMKEGREGRRGEGGKKERREGGKEGGILYTTYRKRVHLITEGENSKYTEKIRRHA